MATLHPFSTSRKSTLPIWLFSAQLWCSQPDPHEDLLVPLCTWVWVKVQWTPASLPVLGTTSLSPPSLKTSSGLPPAPHGVPHIEQVESHHDRTTIIIGKGHLSNEGIEHIVHEAEKYKGALALRMTYNASTVRPSCLFIHADPSLQP
ncbi:hypothetical protein M405DRAFT_867285 [Rhizopogon salebrosus TDB-379]|nr:hypothetical protein M405DRAFT_867285 [Rhizopogon salebrosus TDB-379]